MVQWCEIYSQRTLYRVRSHFLQRKINNQNKYLNLIPTGCAQLCFKKERNLPEDSCTAGTVVHSGTTPLLRCRRGLLCDCAKRGNVGNLARWHQLAVAGSRGIV